MTEKTLKKLEKIKNLVFENRFFLKNEKFSKTAVILMSTWTIVLFKYTFKDCIINIPIGSYVFNWKIVFDWAEAGALLGAAAGLYYYNHKSSAEGNGND